MVLKYNCNIYLNEQFILKYLFVIVYFPFYILARNLSDDDRNG
jgi:hypothetical protein